MEKEGRKEKERERNKAEGGLRPLYTFHFVT
jgi:hypothetical protein